MSRLWRTLALWAALALALAVVAGCSQPAAPAPTSAPAAKPAAAKEVGRQVSFSTASTGGTWYPLGGGIAEILNKNIPGMKMTAESSGGSVENLNRIANKTTDFVLLETGASSFAYNGQEPFKDKPIKNFRGIFTLYPNDFHMITWADSSIKGYADLKGKKVVIGAPGSITIFGCLQVLDGFGLAPSDIQAQYLTYVEAANLLKDKQIDAMLVDAGFPNAVVMDVATTRPIRLLPIPADVGAKIVQKYPHFAKPYPIPKGTYKGVDEDVMTTGVKTLFAVREDVEPDLVYAVTKTIFEHRDDIVKVHPKGASIVLENALDAMPIPVHPGAEKYYKEKGITK